VREKVKGGGEVVRWVRQEGYEGSRYVLPQGGGDSVVGVWGKW